MATIRHIKKARQRYEMEPVMEPDPDNPGQERQVVKTINRKTRRSGREVKVRQTQANKNRPLPPRNCEYDGKPIPIGSPFKILTIKMQYGAQHRFRHESCPTWQPHEYTNALWARISQIQGMDLGEETWESEDDATNAANEVAEAIRELASEKEESAQNIVDGFGHETSQSEELAEQAEQLNSWADEVEAADIPEMPEGRCQNCDGEQLECSTHEQDGHSDDPDSDNYCDGTEECMECNGSCEGEERDDLEMASWRDEAAQAIRDTMENSPV